MRCPGCGDRADLAHVVACCAARIAKCERRGFYRGATAVIEMALRQVGRRGHVDFRALHLGAAFAAIDRPW